MEKIYYYIEKLYPWVGGILLGIIFFQLNIYDIITEKIENVLNGAIIFSSIIVGFLGSLLAILISINNAAIMKHIYDTIAIELLVTYFRETIRAGLLVVIFSILLFFLKSEWLFIFWCFLLTFFILSSYKIIEILLKIIFKSNEKGLSVEDNRLPDAEVEIIKERLSEEFDNKNNIKKHRLSDKKIKE